MSAELSELPTHLQELLEPSPSGAAKLIAAWDGLLPETQMLLLSAKTKDPGYRHEYLRILKKALTSQNIYVRYIAAKNANRFDELKTIVESDPEPLIKFSPLEAKLLFTPASDPKAFFNLPQAARLATIRSLGARGELVAKVISYAVDHLLADDGISELEIFEITLEFLTGSSFSNEYEPRRLSYDGMLEHSRGKNVEALWDIVPKVPESVSQILVDRLPTNAGLFSGPKEQLLETMNPAQLATLFDRDDIKLTEFRKKTFFGAVEQLADDESLGWVGSAAIQHSFDLTNDEFSKILNKPDKQKIDIAKNLASSAEDLRLCLYDALHDILMSSKVGMSDFSWAEFARDAFERKIKTLTGYSRERELKQLRIYRLAAEAIPWGDDKGYGPNDDLSFLEQSIVEGDTWKTFMNFSEKWEEFGASAKNLERHLPDILEAEEQGEDLNITEVEDTDDVSTIIGPLETAVRNLEKRQKTQSIILWAIAAMIVILLFT